MKFTKIVSRRRKEDEIPTPRVAIRNYCIECMGYSVKETDLCTAKECWLYPWRLGKTPTDLKRKSGFGHTQTLDSQESPRCSEEFSTQKPQKPSWDGTGFSDFTVIS